MSIYATNFIIDEETGEAKLVKHLNKARIDRCTCSIPPGGWNKKGSKQKEKKFWSRGRNKDYYKLLKELLNKTD